MDVLTRFQQARVDDDNDGDDNDDDDEHLAVVVFMSFDQQTADRPALFHLFSPRVVPHARLFPVFCTPITRFDCHTRQHTHEHDNIPLNTQDVVHQHFMS